MDYDEERLEALCTDSVVAMPGAPSADVGRLIERMAGAAVHDDNPLKFVSSGNFLGLSVVHALRTAAPGQPAQRNCRNSEGRQAAGLGGSGVGPQPAEARAADSFPVRSAPHPVGRRSDAAVDPGRPSSSRLDGMAPSSSSGLPADDPRGLWPAP